MQGYSVQTVVADGQIILSAQATGTAADQGQLLPAVDQARSHLQRLGNAEPVREVLADSGYWSIPQVRELTASGVEVLIPPGPLGRRAGRYAQPETLEMIDRLQQAEVSQRYACRQQIIEPVFAHWKHIRGITRVLRRGKAAVQAEIDLIATTHNLLKLRTALRPA